MSVFWRGFAALNNVDPFARIAYAGIFLLLLFPSINAILFEDAFCKKIEKVRTFLKPEEKKSAIDGVGRKERRIVWRTKRS